MKDKIIHLPLSRIRMQKPVIVAEIGTPAFPGTLPGLSSGNPSGGDAQARASAQQFSIAFSMQPAELPGWTGGMSDYPATSVTFTFPEGDAARVHAWFSGNYKGVTAPASTTLISNVSHAVKSALEAYFGAAAGMDLFTAPFRVGWVLRMKDGNRRISSPAELMLTGRQSPLVAILSRTFEGTSVTTPVAIVNRPMRLMITPSQPVSEWGDVTHIDIIAAPQPSLIPSGLRVSGVGTQEEEESERYLCYQYPRLKSEIIANTASIQNDFRIIASIPVGDITGTDTMAVPMTAGGLGNWKLLPKYSDNGTSSGGGDNPGDGDEPQAWEPWIDKETEALDLGMPEERKWVRSMILRGCYDRTALRVRLYGARHREDWHLISDGKRGWCAGTAMAGFRWFKVRITGSMRRRDYLDALTFRLTRHRIWR